MQTISDNAQSLLNSGTPIYLKLYHADGTAVDAVVNKGQYTTSIIGNDDFSIGGAAASSLSLTIDGAGEIPKLGDTLQAEWQVGEERYPLLAGSIPDPPKRKGSTVNFTLQDAIYTAGANLFQITEALHDDCTTTDLLTEVAHQIGVSLATPPAVVTIHNGLAGLKGDHSCAQIAGLAAQLLGGSVIIDRQGRLTVRRCAVTDYLSEVYSGGADGAEENYTVGGVTLIRTDTVSVTDPDGVTREEQQISQFRAGDGSLSLENALASQAAADSAASALAGLTWRGGSYSLPGGILLEPGDLIQVYTASGTKTVLVGKLTLELDGGCKASVLSPASSTVFNSGGGAITQALRALEADILRVKRLYADNIEAVRAKINELYADKAWITSIVAEVLETSGLSAEYVKVGDSSVNEVLTQTAEGVRQEISQQIGSLSADMEGLTADFSQRFAAKDDLAEAIDQSAARLNATAQGLDYQITALTERTTTVEGEQKSIHEQFATWFRADKEGLSIGRSDMDNTLHLGAEGIQQKTNGKVNSYWKGGEFHSGDLIVDLNNRAQFGSYAFVPRTDGSLMFLKVGD